MREARRRAGFSKIRALSERLGISEAQLSRYERDRYTPKAELLARFADLTGASMYWITTGRHPAPLDAAVSPHEPDQGPGLEVGAASGAGVRDTQVPGAGESAAGPAPHEVEVSHGRTLTTGEPAAEVA